MRWLMDRYRTWFTHAGYEYPPVYMLISDCGLLFFVVFAAVQRVISGVTGIDWLFVALAVGSSLVAVTGAVVACTKPHVWMLPLLLIGTVAFFWLVPTHGDVAPLVLVLGAAMSAGVSSLRSGAVYTLLYTAAAVIGTVLGVVEQGWVFILMVGFGGAVGHLLQKQLHLLEVERRERGRQVALDRAAIAGEVHDVVAHSLAIVLLNVTAARRALQDAGPADPADIADALDALRDAEQQGRAAMTDVRTTIDLLRNESAPTTAQPGLGDLDELVDGFRRAGSTVSFCHRPPLTALSSATELAVFRVVQESLSNAAKHAPGHPVHVVVEPDAERGYVVAVRNPVSPGTRRSAGGYGLAGMAARVENLNGRVRTDISGGMWHVVAEFDTDGTHGCPRIAALRDAVTGESDDDAPTSTDAPERGAGVVDDPAADAHPTRRDPAHLTSRSGT
ncbi:histidine kinase [Gordonia sp. NB41Y]|uniref:sensor histidine kinase n=1 Tax=Gordonia sp. NB41Y TaxID=875808 RepID=UPI00273B8BA0|nr:histidine kinase [Gordonia sp. NB41Y]WLP90487.1 histidine kinase [Gordonia sp. NB41Y]